MRSSGEAGDDSDAALDLWLDFLGANPGFEPADFEELCARNPDAAGALRELQARTPGLGSNNFGSGAEATGALRRHLTRLSRPVVRGER